MTWLLAQAPPNIMQMGVLAVIFVALLIIIGFAVLVKTCMRKVRQGEALIVNQWSKVIVSFSGAVVWPIIHRAEYMDISVKTIEIDRRGKGGLICADNVRADIKVSFYVRVNKTEEDVLRVAQMVGCDRASDQQTLEELFNAKFSEALKTVGKQMEFTELFTERDVFKERIMAVIGEDLNGYKLDDAAIDYLEMTPIESMDDENILDAQGIRKIVDLTSNQAIQTNEHRRHKDKEITRQDVEARETILELEKQQAEAEARQKREIESIQAKESAETEKVRAESRLKQEQANIAANEQLGIAEENKQRQVEVAVKNRERTIAIETERVERDRALEQVERERLVALKSIEKEKAVEIEKKEIQEVIRERVAVERTVAEEQEKIKDTVKIAEAERQRKSEVIGAEMIAEQNKIEVTVEAEAKQAAAQSKAEERVTLAEAEQTAAEKLAAAKKFMAEGLIAEKSADGMATVKVQEAEAGVIELRGKAEASAAIEAHRSEAFGLESHGEAEAKAMRATASAKAEATDTQGKADASAMTAKYHAEADGINEKAVAMKNFDGVGREHEEFKLRLAKAERIELAEIDVNRQVAEYHSKVLAEAVEAAKIEIVGGGEDFLNTYFKSLSLARSVDGFVANSQVARRVADGEEGNLLERVKDLFASEGVRSEDLKNLTVSALLARLAMQSGDQQVRDQAGKLSSTVKRLGLDDLLAMYLSK